MVGAVARTVEGPMTQPTSLTPLSTQFRESVRPWTRAEIGRCLLFEQVELSTLFGLLDRCLGFDLSPGETLIAPSDTVRCFFLVLDGEFTVHVGGRETDEVARVYQGESVGELRLIDERPPSWSGFFSLPSTSAISGS